MIVSHNISVLSNIDNTRSKLLSVSITLQIMLENPLLSHSTRERTANISISLLETEKKIQVKRTIHRNGDKYSF